MRFLVDADLGQAVLQLLLDRGHDAARAATLLPPGTPDPDVARLALRDSRHLVTGDRNFVWQMVRAKLPFERAILDLRPAEPAHARHFVALLARVLDERTIEDGFHYIVEPARTRVARLPCP
jgi:predicted nuclease of predicted toxin-antitoxin system